MIFNKSERIRDLEKELEWQGKLRKELDEECWELRRDLTLIAEHLGVSFVTIKEKRIVQKKGGPEEA